MRREWVALSAPTPLHQTFPYQRRAGDGGGGGDSDSDRLELREVGGESGQDLGKGGRATLVIGGGSNDRRRVCAGRIWGRSSAVGPTGRP